MDNKKVLLGMLAILLVFGFTLVGCEYGDPGLEGSWKQTRSSTTYLGTISTTVTTLTFTAGEFESKTVESDTQTPNVTTTTTQKGTYVASNGKLGITITSTTAGSYSSYNITSTQDYVIYGSTLLLSGSGVFTKE